MIATQLNENFANIDKHPGEALYSSISGDKYLRYLVEPSLNDLKFGTATKDIIRNIVSAMTTWL